MESGSLPELGRELSECPFCGAPFVDAEPPYDPPDGAGRRIAHRSAFVAEPWQLPPLLSAREAGWLLDAYRWFLTHLGDAYHADRTRLVEPVDSEFVPDDPSRESGCAGGDLATLLFEACKRHAGLSDWPCELVAREAGLVDRFAPNLVLFSLDGEPAGTYHASDDPEETPTITYDPRLEAQPEVLVATFAHELAHGLLDTVEAAPPGGEDFEEPMADLAAVFLGFGIFLCNAAFEFRQDFDGRWMSWQSTTHGYLPEDTLAFALALFLRTHAIDPEKALRHLDPNPRRYLGEALEQLDSIPDEVAALKKLLWSARGFAV